MEFMIKCWEQNNLSSGVCFVCIYDENNCLILNDKTNCNGILKVKLPIGVYKIVVNSQFGTLWKSVLVNSHLCNTIPFVFSNSSISKSTFILTDQNYEGLPIEKGVIILWHNI